MCLADLARDDLSGLRLAKYALGKRIGEGGMGHVFEATHLQLQKKFAIKFIRADLQCDEAIARFESEVAALGRLNHLHLINAIDAGRQDRLIYCVTDLLQGDDLHRRVNANGPMSYPAATEIIRQAALGLAQAHSLGIIHRDIKPSNLFLEDNGNVRVLDFGIARRIENDDMLTKVGQLLGTVDFMSPEQIADASAADERSDIYSLGAVLIYLLSGQLLYPDKDYPSTINKLKAISAETPHYWKAIMVYQSICGRSSYVA